jgi:signal transduction histidine kinase
VEVQEAERRHISRELHDEAGQALTLLMFGLGTLEKETQNPATVTIRAAELKNITNEISKNLHRLAVNLRPASLDHSGLEAALRQYVEKFGHQHHLNIQFEAVGLDDQRLPPVVETNLYRIVQEALANILKHAQATRVDLLLERRGDRIFTIIEDNGVGFDPETAGQSSRLGLLGMRERTEMMGGQLVIESIVNTGTTIYVEVPYVDSDLDR